MELTNTSTGAPLTLSPSSIAVPEQSPQDKEAILKMAVLLLEGLSGFVMSGDVWELAQMHARKRAELAGMPADTVADTLSRLMANIHTNRKSNPLSSMF